MFYSIECSMNRAAGNTLVSFSQLNRKVRENRDNQAEKPNGTQKTLGTQK